VLCLTVHPRVSRDSGRGRAGVQAHLMGPPPAGAGRLRWAAWSSYLCRVHPRAGGAVRIPLTVLSIDDGPSPPGRDTLIRAGGINTIGVSPPLGGALPGR